MKQKKVGPIFAVCLGISCSVYAMEKEEKIEGNGVEEKIEEINVTEVQKKGFKPVKSFFRDVLRMDKNKEKGEAVRPINSVFKEVLGLPNGVFAPVKQSQQSQEGSIVNKLTKTLFTGGFVFLANWFRYLVVKNDCTALEPTGNFSAYGSLTAAAGYLTWVWWGDGKVVDFKNSFAQTACSVENRIRTKTLKDLDKNFTDAYNKGIKWRDKEFQRIFKESDEQITKIYNNGGKFGEKKYDEISKVIDEKMQDFNTEIQLNLKALLEMMKPTRSFAETKEFIRKSNLKMIKRGGE